MTPHYIPGQYLFGLLGHYIQLIEYWTIELLKMLDLLLSAFHLDPLFELAG